MGNADFVSSTVIYTNSSGLDIVVRRFSICGGFLCVAAIAFVVVRTPAFRFGQRYLMTLQWP